MLIVFRRALHRTQPLAESGRSRPRPPIHVSQCRAECTTGQAVSHEFRGLFSLGGLGKPLPGGGHGLAHDAVNKPLLASLSRLRAELIATQLRYPWPRVPPRTAQQRSQATAEVLRPRALQLVQPHFRMCSTTTNNSGDKIGLPRSQRPRHPGAEPLTDQQRGRVPQRANR